MFPQPIPNECPDWQEGKSCTMCHVQFSLTKRASHCRCCGYIFCRAHCSQTALLPQFGLEKQHKVCDECVDRLNEIESMMHKRRNFRSSQIYGSNSKVMGSPTRRPLNNNGTRGYRTVSGQPTMYHQGEEDSTPSTPPMSSKSPNLAYSTPSRNSSLFPNSMLFARSSVSNAPATPVNNPETVLYIPKSHDLLISAQNSVESYTSWMEGSEQQKPDPRNAFAKKHPSKDPKRAFQLALRPRIGYVLRLLLTPFTLNTENVQQYSLFFLTHSLFITTKSLAFFLLSMITLPIDKHVNDRRFLSTQITALSLFQFWVKAYPEDLVETSSCLKFQLNPLFVNKIKSHCSKYSASTSNQHHESRQCVRLYTILQRVFVESCRYLATTNGQAHVLTRLYLHTRTQPADVVPTVLELMPKVSSNIPPLSTVTSLSPNVLAHMLTIQHGRMFSQINPREAVQDSWGKHGKYYNTMIKKLHEKLLHVGLKDISLDHDIIEQVMEKSMDMHDPLDDGDNASTAPPLGLFHVDNGLVRLIQNYNKTALWVASSILYVDDSKQHSVGVIPEENRLNQLSLGERQSISSLSMISSVLGDAMVFDDNIVVVEEQLAEQMIADFDSKNVTFVHLRSFCSFVMVAYDLYLQFNYYGLSAILSGLQQTCIRRLPLWDVSMKLTMKQLEDELNIDLYSVRYGKRGARPNQQNLDMTVEEIFDILHSVTSSDKNYAKYRSHWEYALQVYLLELDKLEDIKVCGCKAKSSEIDALTQGEKEMSKQNASNNNNNNNEEREKEIEHIEIIGYSTCTCHVTSPGTSNPPNVNNINMSSMNANATNSHHTWISGHLPLPLPLLPCVQKDLYTCTQVSKQTVPINFYETMQTQFGDRQAATRQPQMTPKSTSENNPAHLESMSFGTTMHASNSSTHTSATTATMDIGSMESINSMVFISPSSNHTMTRMDNSFHDRPSNQHEEGELLGKSVDDELILTHNNSSTQVHVTSRNSMVSNSSTVNTTSGTSTMLNPTNTMSPMLHRASLPDMSSHGATHTKASSIDYSDGNVDTDMVIVDSDWDHGTTISRSRGKAVFIPSTSHHNLRPSLTNHDIILADVQDVEANTEGLVPLDVNTTTQTDYVVLPSTDSPTKQPEPTLSDNLAQEFQWAGMVRIYNCLKPLFTAIHASQRHGLGNASDASRISQNDFLYPDMYTSEEKEVQVMSVCADACNANANNDCLCKHKNLTSGPGDSGQTSIITIGCNSKYVMKQDAKLEFKPVEVDVDAASSEFLGMHIPPAKSSTHPTAQRIGELSYNLLYTLEENVQNNGNTNNNSTNSTSNNTNNYVHTWRNTILPPFLAPTPMSSASFLPSTTRSSTICACGALVENDRLLHQGPTETSMCVTCIQHNAENGNIAQLEQMLAKTIEFNRNDDTLWNQSILLYPDGIE